MDLLLVFMDNKLGANGSKSLSPGYRNHILQNPSLLQTSAHLIVILPDLSCRTKNRLFPDMYYTPGELYDRELYGRELYARELYASF